MMPLFSTLTPSESDSEISSITLAKSILFIMVRGLTSDLTFAYAQSLQSHLKAHNCFHCSGKQFINSNALDFMSYHVLVMRLPPIEGCTTY